MLIEQHCATWHGHWLMKFEQVLKLGQKTGRRHIVMYGNDAWGGLTRGGTSTVLRY